MASRIDHIFLELDVADEFEGRRTVKFEVSVDDTEFVEMVRLRWRAYSEELWARAIANPPSSLF